MAGRNLIPKVARTFHTIKTVMASGNVSSQPKLASTVLVCRPKQVTTFGFIFFSHQKIIIKLVKERTAIMKYCL